MKYTLDFSSRFRILKGGKISLVVSALLAGSTMTFAAPTGGTVTSGSATINHSGSVTTINQSTNKASINWQDFSIAKNETVNFVQPSTQSVTLNRVVGTTKSLIEGAMNANGQVFLLNPNGVLFANGSQINVGGLVASTLNITDANFQAGNYVFEGNSQNSIINMGTITTAQGGYVAMMGKTVQNEGTIVATMGNVQLASGEKISLNLNGNSLVKLTIDQGTMDALVENKGLIQADGGQVYLTTQALNTILDGMVNNTGIIEAQTLNDVTGKVVLYAHGGTTSVSGTVDATGGFVETSGEKLGVADGTIIKAKEWLLDPTNIVVENGGTGDNIDADVVMTALNAGTDVTLEADENILILESIITGNMDNDATLLLKAGNNVVVGQYQSGTPVLIDATQNGNDNKLNVYISVSNALDNGRFELTGGSSIKTNGGDVIIGGSLTAGLPNTNNTATYQHGVAMYENVAIDAGTGNITIAGKGSGSEISMGETKLKGKDITIDAPEVELSISGITIESSGNAILKGNRVDISSGDIYNENGDWLGTRDTEITANRVEITAGTSLSARDAVIKVNDRATFSATAGEVNLRGTQVLFANTGTLEINAYSAGARQDQIDSLMSDWGASDEVELLSWINDDEGTNYASMDEYFVNNSIYKPAFVDLKGGSYKTKIFSDGTQNTLDTSTLSSILNNGLLAFGNQLESSVTDYGMLKQPWYYDNTAHRWYKLTYSDYPLNIMIGVGGSGYNDGDLYDVGDANNLRDAVSNLTLDLSGFSNHMGTIKVNMDVATSAGTLPISQIYTLDSGKSFLKTVTSITNSTGADVENARLWIGTQDDYVGLSDTNYKTRGNIGANGFEAVANQASDSAKALIVSESPLNGSSGAGILFYSTTQGTNTIVAGDCDWSAIKNANPTSMEDFSTSPEDGSYALHLNLGRFANGANSSVTWYYAAAPVSELSQAINQVGQSAGVTPSTPSTPSIPTTNTVVENQVNNVVTTIRNSTTVTPPAPIVVSPTAPQPQQVQTQAQNSTLLQSILPQGTSTSGSFGLVGSTDGTSPVQTVTMEQLQGVATAQGMGEIRVPLANNSLVELVNGGVTLPAGVTQEFYVVDNSANSGRAQNLGQDDQDKKTKKN